MEMKSPPPCPSSVTIRRNPPRKARPTPSSAIRLREPLDSPSVIRSFPLDDILSEELSENAKNPDKSNVNPSPKALPENLKVYLRIRPLTIQKHGATAKTTNTAEAKNAWPKNPKIKSNTMSKAKKTSEPCVQVNEDLRSVTVSTPHLSQETKRIKSEVYEGFSHVFSSEASQNDVYEEMMKPLVEDFLKGKSGMVAAMGPSGSGKTHTVFGSARQPGMVPLAFRGIFGESGGTPTSRVFYLSMFEICSERGKVEKMMDLLHDGSEISLQQSALKGLQEVVVCDAQQAESLVAYGMLKRATASTNSNNQSSRSQCIINIRSAAKESDGEDDSKASNTTLTILDLAGAEREKRTGNQGARLVESNFINNTSMVFGLCLRALLEHQKNRNKPLQKHYKSSLLTKYLQEYLEGKKRMILILTVKPGMEDYPDTSFLLRQASPFTKIKFKSLEESEKLTNNKRPNQGWPRSEQLKKVKFSKAEASLINGDINADPLPNTQGIAGNVVMDGGNPSVEDFDDGNFVEVQVLSDQFVGSIGEKSSLMSRPKDNKDREYQILLGLSKAVWAVLKEYKKRLEGLEIENCRLRDSLHREANPVLSSDNLKENDQTESMKKTGPLVTDSSVTFPSCSGGVDDHYHENFEDLESSIDAEEVKGSKDTRTSDVFSRSEDLSTSTDDVQYLNCFKDVGIVDVNSESEATDHLGACLYTSQKCQPNSSNLVEYAKNLVTAGECVSDGSYLATSLECESVDSSPHCEDPKEAEVEATQLETDVSLLPSIANQTDSTAVHSQTIHSSESPCENDNCSQVEEEQPNNTEAQEQIHPLVGSLPKQELDVENTSKFMPEHDTCKIQQQKKPKRRLQPASSVLLKDISILNFNVKDEDVRQKGAKGGKTVAEAGKNITQGSLSLLHLLTTKLNQ